MGADDNATTKGTWLAYLSGNMGTPQQDIPLLCAADSLPGGPTVNRGVFSTWSFDTLLDVEMKVRKTLTPMGHLARTPQEAQLCGEVYIESYAFSSDYPVYQCQTLKVGNFVLANNEGLQRDYEEIDASFTIGASSVRVLEMTNAHHHRVIGKPKLPRRFIQNSTILDPLAVSSIGPVLGVTVLGSVGLARVAVLPKGFRAHEDNADHRATLRVQSSTKTEYLYDPLGDPGRDCVLYRPGQDALIFHYTVVNTCTCHTPIVVHIALQKTQVQGVDSMKALAQRAFE